MHENKMNFHGWNHIQIMAYLFCKNEIDRNEIIRLVEEKLKKEQSEEKDA